VKRVADKKVGKVAHYYDQIGVAVIEVLAPIKIGDKIKFRGHEEFEQEIESMQIEHEAIKVAKKGQEVGLKVNQPVKKGDEVYKIV